LLAISNLWKLVSGGLDVPPEDWAEHRRLRGRSSVVIIRKEGTGAISQGTDHRDQALGEVASARDNDEYMELDDLSSITRWIDFPNDSTPLSARYIPKHVPNAWSGPRQILCA
jgi:hypothetical protein